MNVLTYAHRNLLMKFAIRIRFEGKSGQLQGVKVIINSRFKVGSQNLQLIWWSNGHESRVGTGAVRVLAAGGQNQLIDPVNQLNDNNLATQFEDGDDKGSEDDFSQRSASSEDESERDFGDQDGYI